MVFFDRIMAKIKGSITGEIPSELMEVPEYYEEPDVIILPEENAKESASESDNRQKNTDTAVKAVPLGNENTSFEEYTYLFRKNFRGHFPQSLDTIESHMQLLFMIACAVDISPVIEYAGTSVYSRFEKEPEKFSELSRAAVAKTAMELERFVGEKHPEYFCISCYTAQSESLEKAWIVLDFYCRMLKPEFIANINKLYEFITNELIARDLKNGRA